MQPFTILSTDDFTLDDPTANADADADDLFALAVGQPVLNREPEDTAKEMMASMEILGADGRVVYRGGYLTDSGVEERFAPGAGPYPMDVSYAGVDDQIVGVATGEAYVPPGGA